MRHVEVYLIGKSMLLDAIGIFFEYFFIIYYVTPRTQPDSGQMAAHPQDRNPASLQGLKPESKQKKKMI